MTPQGYADLMILARFGATACPECFRLLEVDRCQMPLPYVERHPLRHQDPHIKMTPVQIVFCPHCGFTARV